jgi:hypothetical protein
MTALRRFGVLLAVLLVGGAVFTGGALAQDNDVQDVDQTNVQAASQNADIDQDQSSSLLNSAIVNSGGQSGMIEQDQDAAIDQDLDQRQDVDLTNLIDF